MNTSQRATVRALRHRFTTKESALDLASQQGGDYVRVSLSHDNMYYVTTERSEDVHTQETTIYAGHPDLIETQ